MYYCYQIPFILVSEETKRWKHTRHFFCINAISTLGDAKEKKKHLNSEANDPGI
jgi:hypothetical protein